MANPNTAFRKKLPAVSAVITSTSGIRIGPRSTWNDLPCRACAFQSSIASQIHTAGRIWTSVSRQFENRSLTPS